MKLYQFHYYSSACQMVKQLLVLIFESLSSIHHNLLSQIVALQNVTSARRNQLSCVNTVSNKNKLHVNYQNSIQAKALHQSAFLWQMNAAPIHTQIWSSLRE